MTDKLINKIKEEFENDNFELYSSIEEMIEQYTYLKYTSSFKTEIIRRFNQLLISTNYYTEDEYEKEFLDQIFKNNLDEKMFFNKSYGWGEMVKSSSTESKEELQNLIDKIKINYHKAEIIEDEDLASYANYTIFTIGDSHQFFFEHVEKQSVELIYDEDTIFSLTLSDPDSDTHHNNLSICEDAIKSAFIDLNLQHTDIKTFIDFLLFMLNYDTNEEKLKFLLSSELI
jgi:hypothetical protein